MIMPWLLSPQILQRTYIKIRTFEAQIKITKANIEVQRMGLKNCSCSFNAGQTSLVDVEQAQTEFSETQAKLPPPLLVNLQQQKDALALLLGTIPDEVDNVLAKKSWDS